MTEYLIPIDKQVIKVDLKRYPMESWYVTYKLCERDNLLHSIISINGLFHNVNKQWFIGFKLHFEKGVSISLIHGRRRK